MSIPGFAEEAVQRGLPIYELTDEEHLVLLLQSLGHRRMAYRLARSLVSQFGTLAEVVNAPTGELRKCGVPPTAVLKIRLLAALPTRVLRTGLFGKKVLSSWSQLIDYCRAAMAFEHREQFRVLFLDRKNQLIRDEIQQTGTVDHTPVYPREILRRAIELSATAVILVHNHPSGDPTPSRADIEMTLAVAAALKPMEIVLHDHVIVGKAGHVSLRGMGLV